MSGAEDPGAVGLVDWHRVGRRVRTSVLVLLALSLAAWAYGGLARDDWSIAALAGWIGIALGALFIVELVVVGGAAVGGMLRAGERGERLSSPDVGLRPTRLALPRDRDDQSGSPPPS